MIAASGMILSMMSRIDEVARVSSVVESELRNVRQKLQLKGQDFEKKKQVQLRFFHISKTDRYLDKNIKSATILRVTQFF